MTPKEKSAVLKLCEKITKKLNNLEDLMAFSIRANQRFVKGQRVQFSDAADRSGITHRIKGGVRKGRVVKVSEGFTVTVLLDGYKKPTDYNHSFFENVGRK